MYLSAKTTLIAFWIFCEICVTFAPENPLRGIFGSSSRRRSIQSSGTDYSNIEESETSLEDDNESSESSLEDEDESSESSPEDEDESSECSPADETEPNHQISEEDEEFNARFDQNFTMKDGVWIRKNPYQAESNPHQAESSKNDDWEWHDEDENNENYFALNPHQAESSNYDDWEWHDEDDNNENYFALKPNLKYEDDDNNLTTTDNTPKLDLGNGDLGCKAAINKIFQNETPIENLAHAFLNLREVKFNKRSPNYEYTHGYYIDLVNRATNISSLKLWSPDEFCIIRHKKNETNCKRDIKILGMKSGISALDAYRFLYRKFDITMLINYKFANDYFVYIFNQHFKETPYFNINNCRDIETFCREEFQE